ncbi:MAG: hypothetical protein HY619_07635 [Thaumarchaeota archaeon]|nr:hypothetical protein [Nitrososphaerota archaeon]
MSFHISLVLIRILIVALGLIITYLSFKSHRQNHSSAMLFLSLGFMLITIGVVIEGVLFEFLAFDLFGAHTVESVIVALGLIAIVYSIYGARS